MEMIHELQTDNKRLTHDNEQLTKHIAMMSRLNEQQQVLMEYWQRICQTLTEENKRCCCGIVHHYRINLPELPPRFPQQPRFWDPIVTYTDNTQQRENPVKTSLQSVPPL
jgi:hypothetical protein